MIKRMDQTINRLNKKTKVTNKANLNAKHQYNNIVSMQEKRFQRLIKRRIS